MCSDLQDWQKQITEYFSKQEGLPYHTGDPRRCGFVALYRKGWENFVCDNKDKITKQNRNHTIILKNNAEYIVARTYKDSMIFPYFKKGTMYNGMKSEKSYTLKELGII